MIAAQSAVGDLEARARQSLGSSGRAIYETVSRLLRERAARGVLADIGCGGGNLWRELGASFSQCVGVDAVRYDDLPAGVDFIPADLDRLPLPLADQFADVVAAVEVVEHLENPRAFCRELAGSRSPAGGLS